MRRLEKELTLFDVYAISTGAMFSSGFFLLPGLAAAQTGPSVVLAYLLSAALAVPAMLALAELCTAMPRSGGPYYFLDRSMGPVVGTIGGFGTWLALIFKTAFALIGAGAYLAILVEVPVQAVAIAFTVLFAALNLLGARETAGVQRALVVALLVILSLFVAQGLATGLSVPSDALRGRFTPFLTGGADGFAAAVGMVFVSFAGLMKVASVPEEVRDPDRNLPLGMFLSLATVGVVYGVGIFIMVVVLDPASFHADLTPVASAARELFGWLPGEVGVWLIVAAALAAFAAVSNAGIMSASRYPLAMARDRLLSSGFLRVGARSGTPVAGILATSAAMVAFILVFDVVSVAKLASAFLLLVFGLVNLAVIVMRESRIESYVPGFRSPLYPWLQILGFLAPFLLIAEMGWLPILFTLGVIAGSIGWYVSYAKRHVEREGAMYHLFERLGRRRSEGLEVELRQILKERVAPGESSFDELVTGAPVVDMRGEATFEEAVAAGAYAVAEIVPGAEGEALKRRFTEERRLGLMPVSHGVALLHLRLPGIEEPRLLLLRASGGTSRDEDEGPGLAEEPIRGIFFLVSPAHDAARHLRTLAHLAARADDEGFMEEWLAAGDEQQLKEAVLHEERYLSVRIRPHGPTAALVGLRLREVDMPEGSLVALIQRKGETVVPRGGTVLKEGDRLTIIGDQESVRELAARYVQGGRVKGERGS